MGQPWAVQRKPEPQRSAPNSTAPGAAKIRVPGGLCRACKAACPYEYIFAKVIARDSAGARRMTALTHRTLVRHGQITQTPGISAKKSRYPLATARRAH